MPLGDFETEYGASLIGSTIMRVRGEIVVNQTLFAIAALRVGHESVTMVQANGPADDPHADWMMYLPILQADIGDAFARTFDVRAMRKLDEVGETLHFAVSNATALAGTFSSSLSVLVALP